MNAREIIEGLMLGCGPGCSHEGEGDIPLTQRILNGDRYFAAMDAASVYLDEVKVKEVDKAKVIW